MITAKVTISNMPPDVTLDLTNELSDSADIIAAEIRGSIKRGFSNDSDTGTGGMPLRPNAPAYALKKMMTLGHANPLIAKERKLIDADSYVTRKVAMNHVALTLSDRTHPGAGGLSISEIGTIQHFGDNKIPARPFFGVSPAAVKRMVAYITQRIQDILDGKPGFSHG